MRNTLGAPTVLIGGRLGASGAGAARAGAGVGARRPPEQVPLELEQPRLGPEQMLPGPVAQQALVLQVPAAKLPAEQLVPLPGLAQGSEPAQVLLQPPGRQVLHPVRR